MAVYANPRPKRRSKAPIVLLVLLVVIVLLLVVADRVGHSVADDKLADEVATQAQSNDVRLGAQPTADITGFPFLTQVAAGKYDKILVHLRDVTVQSYAIPKLDITATGVHAKTSDVLNGNGPITADAVSGTATLGWGYVNQAAQDAATQSQISDLKLSGKDGKINIHATLSAAGQKIKVAGTGTAKLAKNGRKLSIAVDKLHPVGTELPSYLQGLLGQVADQLNPQVQLPKLPYGLRLTGIDPQSDGLRVTAKATDVTLAG